MAAARAAARRQAILHSRGDRLAKLTSSARGEDPGGVYAHDGSSLVSGDSSSILTIQPWCLSLDPPLPTLGSGLENFVGERSTLPTPPADPPKTSPKANKDSYPENREWSSAQQQELLRALMGSAGAGQPDLQTLPSIATDPSVEPSATAEDHISTLLASLSGGAANTIPNTAPPRPRTLTKKLLPVLHVVTMLAILVWFVIWKEPETFEASWLSSMVKSEGGELNEFGWRRWARLARGPPTTAGLFVPPVVCNMFAYICH